MKFLIIVLLDAFHILNLFNRGEMAVLPAVINDVLGGVGTDIRNGNELFDRCGIQIHFAVKPLAFDKINDVIQRGVFLEQIME